MNTNVISAELSNSAILVLNISHIWWTLYLRGFDDDLKSGVLHCTTHVCRCAHNRQHTPVFNSNKYFWLIDWLIKCFALPNKNASVEIQIQFIFKLLPFWCIECEVRWWHVSKVASHSFIHWPGFCEDVKCLSKYSSSCVFVICIQK